MNLLVHDEELLKRCDAIQDKINNLLKKELDSEPVYDYKYIKTKVKTYNNKINTNFHGNKISEDKEYCTCFSVILLHSIVNVDKKQPHIFLEECKYIVKKKNIINAINEELNLEKSDDESNESDEDYDCILNGFLVFINLIVYD